MPPLGQRSWARRALGLVVATAGTMMIFIAATVAAAILHLDMAPTRRLVAAQLNAVMRDQFAGDVAIEHIGGLGLHGVEGVRGHVNGPTGMRVLFLDGARVRARLIETARSALFGDGDILVPIEIASIDYVEAAIDTDAAGDLRIANAFAARTEAPPETEPSSARGVRIDIPVVTLRHAWVHGRAAGAPAVDAELHDLAARFHYDAKLLGIDLEQADLLTRGLPRGIDPRGRVGGRFRMPSATGKDIGVEGNFDGVIADIPTRARTQIDGPRIDAVLDARDPSGRGVRGAFGEVAVQEDVTVHAEARGELPRIDAKAHIAVGRGSLDVEGHVDTSDGTRADATVAARHIDVHAIIGAAPASDIGLDTRANLFIAKGGEMSGDLVLDTLPGTLGGEDLPIVSVRGQFTKATAHASGRLLDPRATADFDVALTTAGANKVVEGRIHADVADLSRLPYVGSTLKGHATADANAVLNLGTKDIAGSAHVVASGFAYGKQQVDNATLLATLRGPIDRPTADVGIHAGSLVLGEEKIGAVDLRGRIETGAVTTLRDAHVDMVKGGRAVSATARRVQIGERRLAVEGAVVVGLGEPLRAELSLDPNEARVKLDAPSIDLARVARLAGTAAREVTGGHLAIEGDVALRRDSAAGDLRASVDSLSTTRFKGAAANLEAHLSGKAINLEMRADLGAADRIELVMNDVVVGGSPVEAASWSGARGRARLDANVDLAKLSRLLPRGTLPAGELGGRLVAAATVHRDSLDVPPDVSVHAHTRGFAFATTPVAPPAHGGVDEQEVVGVEVWHTAGVDLSFDARLDAMSGFAEVALHAFDEKGSLLGFDAKSNVPYAQIVAHPSTALALLEKMPLHAKLVIPKRSLADLPERAGTRMLSGTVEADLEISGTALDPKVAFVARARSVRAPSVSTTLVADADVTLDYDGEKAELVATLGTENRRALELGAHLDLRARDLLAPAPGRPLAWGGSARAKLARFPMETINAIADLEMSGHLSGEAVLEDLHHNAKLDANIVLSALKVGRTEYKSGNVVLVAGDGKVTANARLEQTDGFADVQAVSGLTWGDALVPTLDPSADTRAHIEAKGFRASAFLPFLRAQLNTLDGRIDANATVTMGRGAKVPTMEGKLAFHDGIVHVVGLGEGFKDARATVTLQPGGLIKIDDVYLKGSSGEVAAGAVVKTRGLAFESARVNVTIPKRKALDLALQGQPLGEVSGDFKLAATKSEDGKLTKLQLDVPTMNVDLPQQLKASVQSLSENPNIRVGVFRDPKTFVTLPVAAADLEPPEPKEPAATATALDVDVRLGEVTVAYGNQASVVLTGNPHVRIADETVLTGQIEAKGGKVNVQGKTFEIDRGTVTFQAEDASNPIVVLSAEWEADDGSEIFAEFVGPLKTGKMALRSVPPRPRNEVLAIILFGTADGANAPPPPGGGGTSATTKAAVGLGGGLAAQGLTEALDDIAGIKATAKVDTTRARNPAPGIEVQLTRRLSIGFARVLGTPPLSEPDVNLATIDWRFRSNWSIATTFGDRGLIQSDAVWQKRY